MPTIRCRAAGSVRLPGSKSISNRILLLAAPAEGETEIHHLLASDDTARMLDALGRLGVPVSQSGSICRVIGSAGKFPVAQADLFLGNAGTAIRLRDRRQPPGFPRSLRGPVRIPV